MLQREPLDLSRDVTSVADMPVDYGGFGYIRQGRLDGELVNHLFVNSTHTHAQRIILSL